MSPFDKLTPDDLEALIEAARAMKERRLSEDDATVADLWAEWEPAAMERRDWKIVKSSKARLLDTIIKLGDTKTTLAELPWSKCDLTAIDAWRTAQKKRITIRGTPTKPRARDRDINSLQAMFTWHVERKRIPLSPLKGVENEGRGEHREGYYTEQQFRAFVAACHPLLAKAMTISRRCGGMRSSEVRTLRKQDVDWENRMIVIRGERHKNGEMKKIPLTDDVYSLLVALAGVAPGEYLLPNPRDPSGGPVPTGTWGHWLLKAQRKVGFTLLGEAPNYHHTRHTWAMEMLAKGAPLTWIMDVAGWKSTTVVRRYTKLAGQAVEQMREIMNQPAPTARKPAHRVLHTDTASDSNAQNDRVTLVGRKKI